MAPGPHQLEAIVHDFHQARLCRQARHGSLASRMRRWRASVRSFCGFCVTEQTGAGLRRVAPVGRRRSSGSSSGARIAIARDSGQPHREALRQRMGDPVQRRNWIGAAEAGSEIMLTIAGLERRRWRPKTESLPGTAKFHYLVEDKRMASCTRRSRCFASRSPLPDRGGISCPAFSYAPQASAGAARVRSLRALSGRAQTVLCLVDAPGRSARYRRRGHHAELLPVRLLRQTATPRGHRADRRDSFGHHAIEAGAFTLPAPSGRDLRRSNPGPEAAQAEAYRAALGVAMG